MTKISYWYNYIKHHSNTLTKKKKKKNHMIAKQFIHPIRIFIINKNYYIQWENSKEQTFVSYKHKFPENPIFNLNYKQHKNPIFPQRKKKKKQSSPVSY